MDGDIMPTAEWLGGLVWPVVSGQCDIVSGHRWQQVARHRMGAHLIAATDRAITLLPRIELQWACVAWGGSIAMSARAAHQLNLHALLDRVVSDDLALASRAAQVGLRVATHRSLLVPSSNEQSLVAAWRFARRQYQMCRIYRPGLWWLSLGVVGLRLAGWSAALWFVATQGTGIGVLAVLMMLGLLRRWGVSAVARRAEMTDRASVQGVQLVLCVLQRMVEVVHLRGIGGR